MRKFVALIVISYFITLYPPGVRADTPIITVWNYYLTPPFKTSKTEGLAFDFVNLMNKESVGRFHFQLRSVPRSRLNYYLEHNQQGVVLFVNWLWMGKYAKEKYLWSPEILKDRNEVISSIDNKISFEGPESLKGLIFGGIRGRRYKGLESFFSSNEIIRFDVNGEEQVLNMIVKNRVDVTSQPRTLANALIKSLGIEDKIFFSPKPLFHYSRHIMTTPVLVDVHAHLSDFAKNLDGHPEWSAILNKYELLNNRGESGGSMSELKN